MRIFTISLAAVIMFACSGMAQQKITVTILQPETGQTLDPKSAALVTKLVTQYYRLESGSSPYFELKVEPRNWIGEHPRELLIHRLYRDKYLYETDRMMIDDAFAVVRVEQNIQK